MPTFIHLTPSDSEGSDLELGGGQRKSRRRRPFSFRRLSLNMMRSTLFQGRSKIRPTVILILVLFICLLMILVLHKGDHELLGLSDGDRTLIRSRDSRSSPLYSHLHNLVMVAGHAVYSSLGCGEAEGEDSWVLESYQKHTGQAATFVNHIRVGVESAAEDPASLLLFSGGETRKDAGPRSEAQSYWGVAEAKDWFGRSEAVRSRAMTEEHARDSFENLLFSVCRFRELTGEYPLNITVVSYDFKEYRFKTLHRGALRFPASRFSFIGTPSAESSVRAAQEGELHVQEAFQNDPYGCEGPLHEKRLIRDPFLRTVPYPAGCPEIKGLFSYCATEPYSKALPWDDW